MQRSAPSIALTSLVTTAMVTFTGCSSVSSVQNSNFELNPVVAAQVTASQPSFVVGDELGLMMFSQVALAPEASPTFNTQVIATLSQAPTTPKTPTLDWIQNYLALTR